MRVAFHQAGQVVAAARRGSGGRVVGVCNRAGDTRTHGLIGLGGSWRSWELSSSDFIPFRKVTKHNVRTYALAG